MIIYQDTFTIKFHPAEWICWPMTKFESVFSCPSMIAYFDDKPNILALRVAQLEFRIA